MVGGYTEKLTKQSNWVLSNFTLFEKVSGYVTVITIYNPSRCRRLIHTPWWPSEAARWLNGYGLGLGLGLQLGLGLG